MLREGGLQIFITSQGILNSPKNEPIRRALMENNNLVSASAYLIIFSQIMQVQKWEAI